jgi:hypothetical protein
VYRALDRLVATGDAEELGVEAGELGPDRVVFRATAAGRRRLMAWLREPVSRVRDMRLGFLLKLILLSRAGRSPLPLIQGQRAALGAIDSGDGSAPLEVVVAWRATNTRAAHAFLDGLEAEVRAGRAMSFGPSD